MSSRLACHSEAPVSVLRQYFTYHQVYRKNYTSIINVIGIQNLILLYNNIKSICVDLYSNHFITRYFLYSRVLLFHAFNTETVEKYIIAT